MTRFLLKRIGLALITLFLLSVIVFGISTILPGNVGRAVLGPFATQESVDALNEQLGTNRPVFVQYVEWASGLLHGDLGTSLTKQVPDLGSARPGARELVQARARRVRHLRPALDPRRRGRGAALRQSSPTSRSRVAGISLAAMPEFVTGIVLILVFGIWLGWLPVTAQAEEGASALTQIEVPAAAGADLDTRPLRVHRPRHAGRGDRGARRATTRGRPTSRGFRPASSSASTCCGTRCPRRSRSSPSRSATSSAVSSPSRSSSTTRGSGCSCYDAARQKDLPLLTAGVLVIGIVYLVVTLIADILYAALNPRIRLGGAE